MRENSPFLEIIINNWKDIHAVGDYTLSPFIFRGQASSAWELSTSLERIMSKYDNFITLTTNKEHWSLHEFKRKYHLHSSSEPDFKNNIEWLSIMQHHGAPTRLLDFTNSIFIATYFAIMESEDDAAIWCVNQWKLRQRVKSNFDLEYINGDILKDEINALHVDLANQYIANENKKNEPGFVIPVEPIQCTERLSKQRGLFLMPVNVEKSFAENLFESFSPEYKNFPKLQQVPLSDLEQINYSSSYDNSPLIIKLVIPKSEQINVLRDLKKMNITSETLFPGLDGLAKSIIQTVIRD